MKLCHDDANYVKLTCKITKIIYFNTQQIACGLLAFSRQEWCKFLEDTLGFFGTDDPKGAATRAGGKVVAGRQELVTHVECGARGSSKVLLQHLDTNKFVTTGLKIKKKLVSNSHRTLRANTTLTAQYLNGSTAQNLHVDKDIIASVEDTEGDGRLCVGRHLLVLEQALLS